jgi:hypothetical protein
MRIDNSGRVGIGTSSPFSSAKLQVRTGTNLNLAVQTGTTDTTGMKINAFNDPGNANIPLEINGSTLLLKTGETERMRIDSSGNVQVASGNLIKTKTDSGEVIRFERSADTNRYSSIHAYSTDQGNAYISFKVHDGVTATSQADVLHLKGNGNVGINTTNPGAKLHTSVSAGNGGYGRALADSNLILENTNTSNTQSGYLHLVGYTGNSTTQYQMGAIGGGKQTTAADGDYGGYLSLWTTSGGAGGEANSGMYERLRISSSGNVGINTTTPKCTLYVKGNLGVQTASSTISLSSGQADSGLNLATLHDSTRGAGRLRVIGTENALNNGYAEYFYVFSQSSGGTYYVNLKFIDEAVVNNNYGRPRLYLYNSSTYNANSTGRQNTDQTDSSTNSNILQIGITNVADAIGAFYLVAEPIYYP